MVPIQLCRVQWPDDVTGCVLVTERVVPPPEAGDDEHPDPGQVERWARDHPGGPSARLAVSVCRNGDYTCVMRLKEDDSVQLDPRLADGLVTVLLATF